MADFYVPKKAFILAAGLGTRMRPYTDHCPKPMVKVAGRSLIWRTLDRLGEAGVNEAVVNLHYMADILERHLSEYMQQNPDMVIHISREEEILDTGGGVKNALHYFKGVGLCVIAGDALWSDGAELGALAHLAKHWDAEEMDIITLMQPLSRMELTGGIGDYDMNSSGLAQRSADKSGGYMWSNIRLNSPYIYEEVAADKFSFLEIMDKCERSGRLCALEHDGDWHHISTPKDLESVDAAFRGAIK